MNADPAGIGNDVTVLLSIELSPTALSVMLPEPVPSNTIEGSETLTMGILPAHLEKFTGPSKLDIIVTFVEL